MTKDKLTTNVTDEAQTPDFLVGAVSGSAIPVRLQRSRRHKQFSPNGLATVYVGRPTKWGNPFKVTGEDGHWFVINDYDEPLVSFINKEDAIACCVENYKEYISHEHNLGIKNISDLVGKNLSCWCSQNCLCHADILLELATKVHTALPLTLVL